MVFDLVVEAAHEDRDEGSSGDVAAHQQATQFPITGYLLSARDLLRTNRSSRCRAKAVGPRGTGLLGGHVASAALQVAVYASCLPNQGPQTSLFPASLFPASLFPPDVPNADRQADQTELSLDWLAATASFGNPRGPWFAASSPAPAFRGRGSPRGAFPMRARTRD